MTRRWRDGLAGGGLHLCDGWRLNEDGQLQWILQRERPKAKTERDRWRSMAFCGTREGLIKVALPRHKVKPTNAACAALKSLPAHYEPGALGALAVKAAARASVAKYIRRYRKSRWPRRPRSRRSRRRR